MKTFAISTTVVLLAASLSVPAAPIGSSNSPREYLVNRADLGKWSAGVGYRDRTRDVWLDKNKTSMNCSGPVAFVAYDLFPWVTVYTRAGLNETDFEYFGKGESKPQWGGGVRFNLLDHVIADPTLFEDRVRIAAFTEYTINAGRYGRGNVEWGELYASVIFSVVNDVEGNKLYWPYGIALYGGPVFSNLNGDVNEESLFGAVFGIDVFLTSTMALQVEIEQLNDTGYMASLRFQF